MKAMPRDAPELIIPSSDQIKVPFSSENIKHWKKMEFRGEVLLIF
jgi:hypothetical protein